MNDLRERKQVPGKLVPSIHLRHTHFQESVLAADSRTLVEVSMNLLLQSQKWSQRSVLFNQICCKRYNFACIEVRRGGSVLEYSYTHSASAVALHPSLRLVRLTGTAKIRLAQDITHAFYSVSIMDGRGSCC